MFLVSVILLRDSITSTNQTMSQIRSACSCGLRPIKHCHKFTGCSSYLFSDCLFLYNKSHVFYITTLFPFRRATSNRLLEPACSCTPFKQVLCDNQSQQISKFPTHEQVINISIDSLQHLTKTFQCSNSKNLCPFSSITKIKTYLTKMPSAVRLATSLLLIDQPFS